MCLSPSGVGGEVDKGSGHGRDYLATGNGVCEGSGVREGSWVCKGSGVREVR